MSVAAAEETALRGKSALRKALLEDSAPGKSDSATSRRRPAGRRRRRDLGSARRSDRSKTRLPRPDLRATPARRLLVAEFIAAALIIMLSPLSPAHEQDSAADWLRRSSAVAALFVLLGLVATGGPRVGRVASTFGGLVVLAMAISEREVFVTLSNRFTGPAGSGISDTSQAAGPAGTQGAPPPPPGASLQETPIAPTAEWIAQRAQEYARELAAATRYPRPGLAAPR